jgi:hypothetical protein
LVEKPKFKPVEFVCIDFDGVIHPYKKYRGLDVFEDHTVEGAPEGMQYLYARYKTIIHTTRPDTPMIRYWLQEHGCPFHYFNENPERIATGQLDPRKPLADIYLDDKGVRFNGSWPEVIEIIEEFQPWWRAR